MPIDLHAAAGSGQNFAADNGFITEHPLPGHPKRRTLIIVEPGMEGPHRKFGVQPEEFLLLGRCRDPAVTPERKNPDPVYVEILPKQRAEAGDAFRRSR